ncbi:dihydrolipoyl dehydrogenase [Acinetobacter sp. MB5]|uniref:dihydrolipoyl dehydrogenase n=1 Tax=Acinetobacter sp. MB5 TaxID=2069438 RepID=UPI000DCFFF9F|nr:dihydrolipoyl dehydrogenase [Acinetobacter sp. MB5]
MYDIIIIGAGTAGISAYQEAIKHTKNILIINAGPWDTTCARVGCMPSKVLISSANQLHAAQHLERVGIQAQVQADTHQVMQRVRQLRDRFTQATLKDVESWDAAHKIHGQAHFVNPQTVEVNGQYFQAKSFILAVGSTPNINSEWQTTIGERHLTSDQIFELEQLPKSIAVVGSGVIAIELAQALQRLGVKTTIFARSKRVGSLSSPALQQLAQQELSKELHILFETLPEHVALTDQNQVAISYTEHQQPQTLYVDYLLNATGRRSNLSSLQLGNIEPDFKETKHLPIDEHTRQLGQYPIFIVGDAATSTPVQHEAAHEGKMAVHNCLNYPTLKNIKNLTPLSIVFSSPEMASVGQTYRELQTKNIHFIIGKVSYEKQGRALVLGKNQGAIELYIDANSRQLLGAELFVESAEHLAHLLSWMISEQLTLDEILEKPFYHPTLEEGLRTALKHARRQLQTTL